MADETLLREEVNGIHHLVMNHGPNALNTTLMEALSGALAELRADGAPPVLLASSHGVLFCPGWDLKSLADAERNEVSSALGRFNRLVLDLFSYPGPTGAAIQGHAVAGGCLLALCCDLRIMAAGRPRIGLSELNLGVPVPLSSLMMLRERLAADVVEELVVGGDGCNAERAKDLGVVHRIADRIWLSPRPDVNSRGSLPSRRRPLPLPRDFLLGETWRRMSEPNIPVDEIFLDCWFSPETQERIKGTVERLGT